MTENIDKKGVAQRPPVIVVMGHVDHGKSTLLDYIRKTNIVDAEVGGITQKMSAYEVVHKDKKGIDQKITFLDTPGHAAFGAMRKRGAKVADIAILVVSAEDGVKPQTIEAHKAIEEAKLQYIVAINKIDKPNADVNRTKQNLAENNIFLEGWGGNIPFVPISAKTGEGIPELLDMMLLVAEISELKGDYDASPSGLVIESNMDTKKGLSATIIVKQGIVRQGMTATAGKSLAVIKIMEDFTGKKITEATFSSPIKIIGWNVLPEVGTDFLAFENKKEAEESIRVFEEVIANGQKKPVNGPKPMANNLPVIIKADRVGSIEGIIHEISKIKNDRIEIKVVTTGVGNVSENDVKGANGRSKSIVLAFNVGIDEGARMLADRDGIEVKNFDIIYKLSEWLAERLLATAPKVETEEITGVAKILKFFSKEKDKQVTGMRVESGSIFVGDTIKIVRRENEIGTGKIRELQEQKKKVGEVPNGHECGVLIESKVEVAPGDKISCFKIVQK